MAAQPSEPEIRFWAEMEHRLVVTQAIERHLDRLAAENKRFGEEVAHLEKVRQLRLTALGTEKEEKPDA